MKASEFKEMAIKPQYDRVLEKVKEAAMNGVMEVAIPFEISKDTILLLLKDGFDIVELIFDEDSKFIIMFGNAKDGKEGTLTTKDVPVPPILGMDYSGFEEFIKLLAGEDIDHNNSSDDDSSDDN